ncbi:TPA: hypothetical protein ACX6RS_003321 [Photobacterium damselae]|uniref:hypothetical protein n=1 Tax=Photobacterium damselae TaxID=38293 RepID=UPI0040677164
MITMTDKYHVSGVIADFSFYELQLDNMLYIDDCLKIYKATIVNDVFCGEIIASKDEIKALEKYKNILEISRAEGKDNA